MILLKKIVNWRCQNEEMLNQKKLLKLMNNTLKKNYNNYFMKKTQLIVILSDFKVKQLILKIKQTTLNCKTKKYYQKIQY